MKRKTKEAFNWITNLLRKNKVKFQITGGLAAKIYGSKRPLADIDIELHDKDLDKILPYVKKYIVKGPTRYIDKQFNTYGIFLRYKGQEIDLCGSDTQKLFYKKKNKWTKERINLDNVVKKRIFNKIVPVVPLKDLIYYKKKILRKVDLIDIKNLKK